MGTYAKGNKFLTKVTVPVSYDARGRVTRMTDTQEQGEAWELSVKSAVKLGKPLPDVEGKAKPVNGRGVALTIAQLLEDTEALQWRGNKDSSKTVLNASIFRDWVGPKCLVTDAFTQANIDGFCRYLLDERKVAPPTVNRYKSAVNVMMGRVKRSLREVPEWPTFKENEGRLRHFCDNNEEALIETAMRQLGYQREADFFVFLCWTGLRCYQEGLGLPWSAVTADAVTAWDTKNGGFRTVPLFPAAREMIARQRQHGGPGPFTNIGKRHMRTVWGKVRTVLPQLDDADFYCCRHTCATRLLRMGMPIQEVQRWMGHKDLSQTQKYAILAPNALAERVRALVEQGLGTNGNNPALHVVPGKQAVR